MFYISGIQQMAPATFKTELQKTVLVQSAADVFLFFITCGDALLYSKDFCHTIGISRVSFAPVELLHDMLGTNIGAATILSI